MKKLKKMVSLILTGLMLLGTCSNALAATPATPAIPEGITYDLNSYDLTKPFTEKKTFTDSNGQTVEVINKYTPKPQARGSETKDAVEGFWESYMSYGAFGMSFTFDLSKSSNGGWTISNAGDLLVYAFVVNIKSSSVTIGRATSSASSPARVTGSAKCSLFDAYGVSLFNDTMTLKVTVSHSGVVTTTW